MKREREKNQAHTRKIYQFKKEGGEKKEQKRHGDFKRQRERTKIQIHTGKREKEKKKKI